MSLEPEKIARYRHKYRNHNKFDRAAMVAEIAKINKKETIPVIMNILDEINQINLKEMDKILGDKKLLLSEEELKRIVKSFAQETPLEDLNLESVKKFVNDLGAKRMPPELANNKDLARLLKTDLSIRYIHKVFYAIDERQNLIKHLGALVKKLSHLTEQKVRNPLHTLIIAAKHTHVKSNTEKLWAEAALWIDGLYQSTKKELGFFEQKLKDAVDFICRKKFNMSQDDIASYDEKLVHTIDSCLLSFKTKDLTNYLQADPNEKINHLAEYMEQCTLVAQQNEKLNFISEETQNSFADYLKSNSLTTFDEKNETKELLRWVINSQNPQDQIEKLLVLDKKFKEQQSALLQTKADGILLKIFDTIANNNHHLKRAAL